jgi:glutamate racemase
LTVLKEIQNLLPQYDYLYLGDNARAPYGNRSFDTVYQYTLEAVKWLFDQGCDLVILACNTASAKALRNIQQLDLPKLAPDKRVLGVIRPTTEIIGTLSRNGHLGIFATKGTVNSESYLIEIAKIYPNMIVSQEACPLFVSLIENNEHIHEGADYFVKKYIRNILEKDDAIDTLLLACTHYPILIDKIRTFLPENISIVEQGSIVAQSLQKYLLKHTLDG